LETALYARRNEQFPEGIPELLVAAQRTKPAKQAHMGENILIGSQLFNSAMQFLERC